jgi:hypothetical protein
MISLLAQNAHVSDYYEWSGGHGSHGSSGVPHAVFWFICLAAVVLLFVLFLDTVRDTKKRWIRFRNRKTTTSVKEIKEKSRGVYNPLECLLGFACTGVLCYLTGFGFCGTVCLIPVFMCLTGYAMLCILPPLICFVWNTNFLRRAPDGRIAEVKIKFIE